MYSNFTVIVMVLVVVTCVLSVGYTALYFLDKSVDRGAQ
jgi:hypothetical protein